MCKLFDRFKKVKKDTIVLDFCHLTFEFVSDFDILVSNF